MPVTQGTKRTNSSSQRPPSPPPSPPLEAKHGEPVATNSRNHSPSGMERTSCFTHSIWPDAERMLSSLGFRLQAAWILQVEHERQKSVHDRFDAAKKLIDSLTLTHMPEERREALRREMRGILSELQASFENIGKSEDPAKEKAEIWDKSRQLFFKLEEAHPHLTLLLGAGCSGCGQDAANIEWAQSLVLQILFLALFTKTLPSCFPVFDQSKADSQATTATSSSPNSSQATTPTYLTEEDSARLNQLYVFNAEGVGSAEDFSKLRLQQLKAQQTSTSQTTSAYLAQGFALTGQPSSSSVPIPAKGRPPLSHSASEPNFFRMTGNGKGKSRAIDPVDYSYNLRSSIPASNFKVSEDSEEENGSSASDSGDERISLMGSLPGSVVGSFADSGYHGSPTLPGKPGTQSRLQKEARGQTSQVFNPALSARNPGDVALIGALSEQNVILLRLAEKLQTEQANQKQEIRELRSMLLEQQKSRTAEEEPQAETSALPKNEGMDSPRIKGKGKNKKVVVSLRRKAVRRSTTLSQVFSGSSPSVSNSSGFSSASSSTTVKAEDKDIQTTASLKSDKLSKNAQLIRPLSPRLEMLKGMGRWIPVQAFKSSPAVQLYPKLDQMPEGPIVITLPESPFKAATKALWRKPAELFGPKETSQSSNSARPSTPFLSNAIAVKWLSSGIQKIIEQLSRLWNEVNALKRAQDVQKTAIEKLQSKSTDKQVDLETADLKAERDRLSAEVAELNALKNELTGALQGVQAQVKAAKGAATEALSSTTTLSKELEDRTNKINQQINVLSAANVELKQKFLDAVKEIEELESVLAKQENLQLATAQQSALIDQLTRQRGELEAGMAAFGAVSKAVADAIPSSEVQRKKLEANNNASTKIIAKMTQLSNVVRKQTYQLNQQHNKFAESESAWTAKSAQLTNILNAAETVTKEVNEQTKSLSTGLNALSMEMGVAEKTYEKSKAAREDVDRLTQELNGFRTTLNAVDETRTQASEKSKAVKEDKEQLTQELNGFRTTLNAVDETRTQASEKSKAVKEDKEQLTQELNGFRTTLNAVDETRTQASEKSEAIKKDKDQLTQELKEFGTTLNAVDETRTQADEKSEAIKKDKDQLTQELNGFRTTLNVVDETHTQASEKSEAIKKDKDQLTQELKEFGTMLNAVDETRTQADEKSEAIKKDKEQLTQELNGFRTTLNAVDETRTQANEKSEAAKKDKDQLTRELNKSRTALSAFHATHEQLANALGKVGKQTILVDGERGELEQKILQLKQTRLNAVDERLKAAQERREITDEIEEARRATEELKMLQGDLLAAKKSLKDLKKTFKQIDRKITASSSTIQAAAAQESELLRVADALETGTTTAAIAFSNALEISEQIEAQTGKLDGQLLQLSKLETLAWEVARISDAVEEQVKLVKKNTEIVEAARERLQDELLEGMGISEGIVAGRTQGFEDEIAREEARKRAEMEYVVQQTVQQQFKNLEKGNLSYISQLRALKEKEEMFEKVYQDVMALKKEVAGELLKCKEKVGKYSEADKAEGRIAKLEQVVESLEKTVERINGTRSSSLNSTNASNEEIAFAECKDKVIQLCERFSSEQEKDIGRFNLKLLKLAYTLDPENIEILGNQISNLDKAIEKCLDTKVAALSSYVYATKISSFLGQNTSISEGQASTISDEAKMAEFKEKLANIEYKIAVEKFMGKQYFEECMKFMEGGALKEFMSPDHLIDVMTGSNDEIFWQEKS